MRCFNLSGPDVSETGAVAEPLPEREAISRQGEGVKGVRSVPLEDFNLSQKAEKPEGEGVEIFGMTCRLGAFSQECTEFQFLLMQN